ncbi:MAG: LAGLIDADG family homing endonuclease [Candidatus Aenigmatarchaeota archaeon]
MIRQANSIIKFANSIGFNSRKKKEKLQKLVENVGKLKRKRHNKRWERIVKIIYHPPESVYDIEVPIHHKFVANGIVCHNTAKSALMKVVSSLIPRGRYVSGKGVSIDYDDPVIYKENGLIKTDIIGRLCDKFYKQDEVGFVKVKGIEVPVFDPTTFKISWKPVTYIFRHTAEEPLLKLTLRTGREIRVTPGHSIYTLDKGEIVAKRADKLKVGDFILIPSRIPPTNKIIKKISVADLVKNHPEIKPRTLKRFPKEIKVNGELMRLIGYYIAEGSLNEGKEHWKVRFDVGEKDKEIIEDIKRIVKKLFRLEVKEYKKKNCKGKALEINSKLLVLIFKEILQLGKSAKMKKIPSIVFNTSSKNQLEFIKAYLKGDYGVTTSKELASDLQYLFLLNGVISSFLKKRIKGKIKFPDHLSFVDTIAYELKAPKVSKLLKGIFSISRIHGYPPLKCLSSEKILNLAKSGYKRVSKSAMKILFSPYNLLLFSRLEMLRKGIDAKKLSRICKINRKSASHYLNSLVKKGLALKIDKEGKRKYFLTEKGKLLLKEIKLINSLLSSDLGFVEIKKIERVKASKRFVYDLGVENFNNFVAGFGGVICHNTAAGLTATVVRDEEFLGGWVLEAGALVMCNGSLCAIDEFEKVEKSDQIALHEAMEQQSYHPSTEILLADGRKVKIGEFVDRLFNLLKDKIVKGINCEILPLHEIYIPILTTDGQKLFVTKITQVSRHKPPEKFIKITYSNGREIIVTPEHPVFVFEDSLKTKPATKVRPGDFVPGVRQLPLITLSKNLELPSTSGRKKINFPTEMSTDFGKFLGYFISEGYSYSGSSKEIGISNTSKSIISETQNLTNTLFGINALDYSQINRTQRIISSSLFDFMLKNFPEIMQKARNKRIPPSILTAEKEILREFLKAAFKGDGSIESNAICYTTASFKLAEDYQDALLRFGIFSRIAYDKHNNSYKVYITSDSLENFARIILRKKCKKIEKLIKTSKRKLRKHDVLPASVGLKIRNLMKKVGLVYSGYFNQHLRFNFGITREVFDKYLKQIREKIEESKKAVEEIQDFKELRRKLNYSQEYVANLLKIERSKINYIERGGYTKEIREKLLKLFKENVKKEIKKVEESLNQLEDLKKFRWLRVKKVDVLENKGSLKAEWVYDVTVKPTKCFISNGLILHNTISIAKASIVATLPARTSILAGGNPKFGRFDPYLPIKEQIDVPETLLARFDLKFALRDIPNPELDSKIAEHILKARHYGEEEVKPEIEPEFIKKYVAYARKNCHPKLTREAGEVIKDFFVKLREKVSGEEAPIPITLRQYEALIRLAEASAKVQLRNEVTVEDAMRAINLMKASLRQFGFDPETGKIDIDRAEGHIPSSQRGKIRIMLDIIEELTQTFGKSIPVDEIIRRAKESGVDNPENILRSMKSEGIVFEPSPGFIQKI